ncbi:MAG: metal-sulfur cluster assembly factor [Chloroflexi bacterium]|nr:metal-sulfur cluster assembly factor [Chloroflexota bacterium]
MRPHVYTHDGLDPCWRGGARLDQRSARVLQCTGICKPPPAGGQSGERTGSRVNGGVPRRGTPVAITEEQVLEVLRDVYDPEIPVNVVDLGLVYGVEILDDMVRVTMTMTAPGCPFHTQLSMDAQERIIAGTGAKDAEVEIVWDPPWTPDRITEEGRALLGWF